MAQWALALSHASLTSFFISRYLIILIYNASTQQSLHVSRYPFERQHVGLAHLRPFSPRRLVTLVTNERSKRSGMPPFCQMPRLLPGLSLVLIAIAALATAQQTPPQALCSTNCECVALEGSSCTSSLQQRPAAQLTRTKHIQYACLVSPTNVSLVWD